MKSAHLFMAFLLLCASASAATPGKEGVERVHRCIMQNDAAYCHVVMTRSSAPWFDRFASYRLMPCLPTDFAYISEEMNGGRSTAKVMMPAGGGQDYRIRLVFVSSPSGPLLDIPATLNRGLGADWQNKIQLSEQLYLMMKQNMGNKLTCDMLTGLMKPN